MPREYNSAVLLTVLADSDPFWADLWSYLCAPFFEAPGPPITKWPLVLFAGGGILLLMLPLMLALLAVPRRHLPAAIVLVGLTFVGYLFGVFYLVVWLALCVGAYLLSERLAIEFRRTDVLPLGPPLAAWLVFGGVSIALTYVYWIRESPALAMWAFEHAAWLLPVGMRGISWEPALYAPLFEPRDPRLGFLNLFSSPHLIGHPYLAMRMLHYLSEIKRGTIRDEDRSLVRFLAYVCYPPNLIQGPIERYGPFYEQLDACGSQRSPRDAAVGLARIALGLLRGGLATAYLWPIITVTLGGREFFFNPRAVQSYGLLCFGAHIYAFWLYLMFSGYCDISIGISRLIGVRTVENFYWPWFSTSLVQLWRRWHISLSFILRDYIFIPLTRKRFPPKLGLIVTFVVCGVWHSLIGGMVLWGLFMGIAVGVNQSWARWMRNIDRKPNTTLYRVRHAWLRLHPLPSICAWFVTINAFVLSAVFFFGDIWGARVLWEIVRRPVSWIAGG